MNHFITHVEVSTLTPIREIGFISRFAHGITEDQYRHDGIQILKDDVFSVAEHIIISFECEVTERLARQINRHRHISIVQQSTRYNEKTKENIQFWLPKDMGTYPEVKEYLQMVLEMKEKIQLKYDLSTEEINYLLPLCNVTTVHYTMNLRTLMHMFSVRTCNFAMFEFREFLKDLKAYLEEMGSLYGEWEYLMHFYTSCQHKNPELSYKEIQQKLYEEYCKKIQKYIEKEKAYQYRVQLKELHEKIFPIQPMN